MGLCCAEEERGETPGREGSPSDLVDSELDPGGESKSAEDKAFGRTPFKGVLFSTKLLAVENQGSECRKGPLFLQK